MNVLVLWWNSKFISYIDLVVSPHNSLQESVQPLLCLVHVVFIRQSNALSPPRLRSIRLHAQEHDEAVQVIEALLDRRATDGPSVRSSELCDH